MVRFVGVTSVCPCARVSRVAGVCTVYTCPALPARRAPPGVFYRYYSLLSCTKKQNAARWAAFDKGIPSITARAEMRDSVPCTHVYSVAVLCALALRMGFGLGSWMCLVQPDASPEDRCAQTWRRPAGRAQPD